MFTEILVKNKIHQARDITNQHFDELFKQVSKRYARRTAVCRHTHFVAALKNLPDLDKTVYFYLTRQSYIPEVNSNKRLSIKDIEKKLNGDYSDKVMFQIAAYTYYSLDLIFKTIKETKVYIESAEYIDLLEIDDNYERGVKRYIGLKKLYSLIQQKKFGAAMQVELAAVYKVMIAYDTVNRHVTAEEYTAFCSNPVLAKMPKNLSENTNLIYVIKFLNRLSPAIKAPMISTFKSGSFSFYPFLNFPVNPLFQSFHPLYAAYLSQFSWPNMTRAVHSTCRMLLGRGDEYLFLVQTYLLMNGGHNLEVYTTIPAKVGGKTILENFSKETGCGEDAPINQQQIGVYGYKNKVGNIKMKKIPFDIPVKSPAFQYMSHVDVILEHDRKFFFGDFNLFKWRPLSLAFIAKYQILNDNNTELTSLESRKFRKTFAGHKLIERLKDVNSTDELIHGLRNDMNQKDFSVTMGYLMQSGNSSSVIDATLVALQMKMLDDALEFAGKIKSGKRLLDKHERFLCDCADPSNPPHDVNLKYCRQFHLCLGCPRSEVYEEHLPAIIYSIFNIEATMVDQPDVYKIALEDKHIRAKDVIQRFKLHTDGGDAAVERAYQIATAAKVNGTPLVPPMLNI